MDQELRIGKATKLDQGQGRKQLIDDIFDEFCLLLFRVVEDEGFRRRNRIMPSHSTTTGANTTPLGRVNPALLAAQTRRALLNPNYLGQDQDDNSEYDP